MRASITELVLWLKRPRIARGQSKTYSFTPAETRFMSYYGHLDLVGQASEDPTNFAQFDGFDQKQPQVVGSFRVRFTRWLAQNGVTTATRRTLGELEITLNDQDLFDFIEDLGNAHAATREHTLILRTGTPLCKAFPTSAQQLGGQGPLVSAHRGRMILRFQKRHASYITATRTMIFSKYGAGHAALGNLGTTQLVAIAVGVQTFPNGVPYLCFEHDLYPRQ